METIDYKARYLDIPSGYKHEVQTISYSQRSDIHFFLNDTKGKVGKKKSERIRNAIKQVWKPHNIAESIDVRLKRKIVVETPTKIIHLEYAELMEFQIDITGTIGGYKTKKEAISFAYEDINLMNKSDPYEVKLLICKYLIRKNIIED